ncbi:MAG: flavodoxin family protein [Acidobacteria bacterium]|jgi:NAD(P)H dehydrogenase (quinone)|nr:flavodoxin family protein [Acidobacteriota bacterium]
MSNIAIVYHSGYGHTAKVAEHVRKGASSAPGTRVTLYRAEDLADPARGPWGELAKADAIIFGAPTYMGSASGVMKTFIDATSKAWFTRDWANKIAAGFTVSGSLSGDKTVTLQQFATLAAQHGMVWVGADVPSGYNSSKSDFATAHNRAGHFLGLAVQALTDLPADQTPDRYELETAELFGKRVAEATLRWVRVPAEPELA